MSPHPILRRDFLSTLSGGFTGLALSHLLARDAASANTPLPRPELNGGIHQRAKVKRFIQLYHRGWDQHNNLPSGIRSQCHDTDQPTAALLAELKGRGLLEDTLIIWGGEFGRTVYSQGVLTKDNYGRDHHPRCYSIWLAGAGIKGGQAYGETDDFSYNIVKDPVHIHDLNATALHLLGLDHTKLTYRFQGRDFRLTDVYGNVVHQILV